MKSRLIAILKWASLTLLFLLACWGTIYVLLNRTFPYERPAPLTAAQAAFCDGKKPEWASTLIIGTSTAHWTMVDGGTIVCMRR